MKPGNIILTVIIVVFVLGIALAIIAFAGLAVFEEGPTSVEVGPATPVSAP